MSARKRSALRADPPSPRADSNGAGMSGYEGAQYNSIRSAFWTFPTNSRREINSYTRQELLRKVRALDANLGIISRIKHTVRRRAVGRGIGIRPTTMDEEWNTLNRKQFENWASAPGVYSIDASRDFWEDQALAAESLVADGEFFEALVRTDSGAPMVQPLDPFEIGAGQSSYNGFPDGKWEDGILPNEFLRPIAYAVRELPPTTFGVGMDVPFRTVPAQSMIHIFRRRRAKQLRGLTWFFSGINQGIDALDLRALITGTAKLHSGLAVVVKGTGKVNKRGAFGKIEQLGNSDSGNATDTRALERIYGSMINYLGAEGEVDLKSSTHPSTNLLDFLKFLYRDMASGLGVPLEVVYTLEDLNGANSRLTNDDAQLFFDGIQDMIFWQHSRRIYVWNTALRIQSGQIRPCKDPNWWQCSHRGPRKLTADNGRTAQANVLLLRNGAETHENLFESQGLDAFDEMVAEGNLLKRVRAEINDPEIFNLMFQPTPGAQPAAGAGEPDDDEEGNGKKKKNN